MRNRSTPLGNRVATCSRIVRTRGGPAADRAGSGQAGRAGPDGPATPQGRRNAPRAGQWTDPCSRARNRPRCPRQCGPPANSRGNRGWGPDRIASRSRQRTPLPRVVPTHRASCGPGRARPPPPRAGRSDQVTWTRQPGRRAVRDGRVEAEPFVAAIFSEKSESAFDPAARVAAGRKKFAGDTELAASRGLETEKNPGELGTTGPHKA